jgi:type I restriction enzyme S subunit
MKKVEDNGLKQTDVGFIPKDWELDTLGNIFNIQQGKSLSPKSRRGISPQPFLRTANVLWGRVDLSKLDQMDFSEPEIAKLALEMEDLLICEGGDIGRTAIWEKQIPLCLYQNHLHRLRANRSEIIPRFYMYWMQAALTLLGLYEGAGNRTTIPNLSRSRLSSFLVPVPSKKEQEAIVIILRKLQKVISQQEQIILKTKELKRSLMHRLFTYGLRGEELKETEIGLMPKNWEIKPFESLCENVKDSWNPGQYLNGIYVGLEHIESGNSVIKSFGTAQNLRSSKFIFSEGDILYGKLRPYLDKAVITNKKGICSTDILVFRPKNNAPAGFIVNLIHWSPFIEYAKKTTHGVNHPRTSWNSIRNFTCGIPQYEEQQEIANILSNVDNKIQQAETRKQTLQSLFKSMLQLLMTGQVRVKDIDFGEIYPVRET